MCTCFFYSTFVDKPNSDFSMKKTILLVLFSLITKSTFAQSNELKLDLFDVLALLTVDVSFEHNMNSTSSFGVSALFNFEKPEKKFRYEQEFVLTPYFRQVFSQRGDFNYFGEIFGSLNQGKKKDLSNLKPDESENYYDFALGVGVGVKYLTSNGFVADIHAGIGRNLLNTDFSPSVIPRVGISVGKEF